MCIVIDINAIPSVFDSSASDHADFRAVLEWIIDGKGCMLVGGNKYNSELEKLLSKYGRNFALLARLKKLVKVDDKAVDAKHCTIVQMEDRDFDDSHLVSLLDVSGCLILCTKDKRSCDMIKNRRFYSDGMERKIYKRSEHKHLLSDEQIRGSCLPCRILRKDEKPDVTPKVV